MGHPLNLGRLRLWPRKIFNWRAGWRTTASAALFRHSLHISVTTTVVLSPRSVGRATHAEASGILGTPLMKTPQHTLLSVFLNHRTGGDPAHSSSCSLTGPQSVIPKLLCFQGVPMKSTEHDYSFIKTAKKEKRKRRKFWKGRIWNKHQ